MMGTFASVLATRKIRSHTDRFRAEIEGDIEDVNGVLKITVIRVHYTLKLKAEEEADARWALANYIEKCPGAMSVTGCIRIDHRLTTVVE
ncbi:hypothetical protein JCM30471_11180 [Desulfuromonas carbonis]|uniref:OsmC family protein n=1 Tax=Desulfuromonas sp. DDH964 TaxID=1823759 RepID=UPI00078E3683|nr:OsmC family protein [Desulfuromonas sp. DDH964]AMV72599.1 hypothetical protein DBW_2259 [Desulfuromonas sp. DDH964]